MKQAVKQPWSWAEWALSLVHGDEFSARAPDELPPDSSASACAPAYMRARLFFVFVIPRV